MNRTTLPRVFIADASPAVIERLAASIDDVALLCGRATNAKEAIIGIRCNNPHLCVFDVAMINGVDLLRQIKKHHPPVVSVILTHSADDTTRQVCLRMGAEYFLDKIADFAEVRHIMIAMRPDHNGPAEQH